MLTACLIGGTPRASAPAVVAAVVASDIYVSFDKGMVGRGTIMGSTRRRNARQDHVDAMFHTVAWQDAPDLAHGQVTKAAVPIAYDDHHVTRLFVTPDRSCPVVPEIAASTLTQRTMRVTKKDVLPTAFVMQSHPGKMPCPPTI